MRSRLETIGIALLGFLAPIEGVILTTLGLVLVDMITGLGASYKQSIPLTSYGLKRTVIKLFVYELAILLAFVVGLYLTGPTLPVLHLVSSLIGLTELKSVLENLNIIGGGSLLNSIVSAIQGLSSNDPGKGD